MRKMEARAKEDYQGGEAEEFPVESVEHQAAENKNCALLCVAGDLENHHTGRAIPTDVELETEAEPGAGLNQGRQQEKEVETQENNTQVREAAKEGNQYQTGTQLSLSGRGYYPRPRFVTAPVTRQSQKERVEAITIVTQVTPERRAVEKRRILENREPLNLRAEFMDVRSRTRRQPQTGEHNFLISFPTSNVAADLSVLLPTDLRTDEAIEWIHRLEPWRGDAKTPLLSGIESDRSKKTRNQSTCINARGKSHRRLNALRAGGYALLISAKLRMLEFGVYGFGGAAWATMHAANGSVMVASLHAPNQRRAPTLHETRFLRRVF
ncbi:hypothetical protein R1sor_012287 [Riccia sorocarpa]|uniref:Uncharacterized protein n=1 Tax=Riccia sorocarpa TaxID=122646 RepID=A0ABD3I458_9MARC